MAITRSQTFQPGTFLKACSICGFRFRANELRRGEDGFWRCVAYCLEVPSITRDKISAMSQKRKEAPPPPHGTPFEQKSAYAEEAVIFNFLCEQQVRDASWPGGFRLGVPPFDFVYCTNGSLGGSANIPTFPESAGYSVTAAAETCRYLYNLVNDNLRPLRWISVAKTKVRQLADWLITIQRGFGVSPSSTKTNDALYGGIATQDPSNFGLYSALENSAAGLAFLYSFRVLGDTKYLLSAKASASFLRNMQAVPGTTYLGAIPINVGAPFSATPDFYSQDLLALEFWTELLTTAGDALYGSDGTPAGISTIPQQLLSRNIADLRSFWSVGAIDNAAGAVITGLSANTPADHYAGGFWLTTDGGTVSNGLVISGRNFAIALRSLFNVEGFSSQVSSVWNWLMSFASNSEFTSSVGTLATDYLCAVGTKSANPVAPPAGQGNIVAPSFDPKLALTVNLQVRSSTTPFPRITTNGVDYRWRVVTDPIERRSTYDWTTFGLMAGIQSSKDQGAFKKAKDTAVTMRYRMPITFEVGAEPITENVLLRGSSGLAFQLSHFDDIDIDGNGTPTFRLWSATAAAMIGGAFRYQPQGYTGSPAPGQPYSQKPPGVQA